MANLLTMADIQAILGLHERGWRQRRIARELAGRPGDGRKVHPSKRLRSKTSQSAHRLGGGR